MQTLVEIDREILSFFNGSDSLFLDNLVVFLTSGLTWIPLYMALLYVVIKNSETMMNELSRLRGLTEGSALEADQRRTKQMEEEIVKLRESSKAKEDEVQELKRKVQRLEALKNELNEHLNAKEKELKALYKQNRNPSQSHSFSVCFEQQTIPNTLLNLLHFLPKSVVHKLQIFIRHALHFFPFHFPPLFNNFMFLFVISF